MYRSLRFSEPPLLSVYKTHKWTKRRDLDRPMWRPNLNRQLCTKGCILWVVRQRCLFSLILLSSNPLFACSVTTPDFACCSTFLVACLSRTLLSSFAPASDCEEDSARIQFKTGDVLLRTDSAQKVCLPCSYLFLELHWTPMHTSNVSSSPKWVAIPWSFWIL